MKVKDLIGKLLEYDLDAEVKVEFAQLNKRYSFTLAHEGSDGMSIEDAEFVYLYVNGSEDVEKK